MNETNDCPHCNNENPATGKFCINCGMDLKSTPEEIIHPQQSTIAAPAKTNKTWIWVVGVIGLCFVCMLLIAGGYFVTRFITDRPSNASTGISEPFNAEVSTESFEPANTEAPAEVFEPVFTEIPTPEIDGNLIFFIDFESPKFKPGEIVYVDNSLSTPSKVSFGDPIVSDRFSSLNSKCLLFNTNLSLVPTNNFPHVYDQLLLDVDRGYQFYSLSLDLVTFKLAELDYEFAIFFDIPKYNKLIINREGIFMDGADGLNGPIADVPKDGTVLHLTLDISFDTGKITVKLNQDPIASFSVREGPDLKTIRFNLSPNGSLIQGSNWSDEVIVAIDNILVFGR